MGLIRVEVLLEPSIGEGRDRRNKLGRYFRKRVQLHRDVWITGA